MTNEEILEGNKLIAEFMGFEFNKSKIIYDPTDTNPEGKLIGYPLSNLKYHSSWDWLIPVIDKIHSSNYYVDYYLSELGQFNNGVHINTKFIEVSFDSVIEFIKWYNSKQNTNE